MKMSSFKYTKHTLTEKKLFDKLFIYRYTFFTLVSDICFQDPPQTPLTGSLNHWVATALRRELN